LYIFFLWRFIFTWIRYDTTCKRNMYDWFFLKTHSGYSLVNMSYLLYDSCSCCKRFWLLVWNVRKYFVIKSFILFNWLLISITTQLERHRGNRICLHRVDIQPSQNLEILILLCVSAGGKWICLPQVLICLWRIKKIMKKLRTSTYVKKLHFYWRRSSNFLDHSLLFVVQHCTYPNSILYFMYEIPNFKLIKIVLWK
jgi:hypothetical protein